MKLLLVLSTLATVAFAQHCYKDVEGACSESNVKLSSSSAPVNLANCNAVYGGIEGILPELQKYANKHITHSFQYLLLSTHFANYQMNRKGFETLFRKYSDKAWNDGIELIKYMTKRGAKMDFAQVADNDTLTSMDTTFQLYELQSLSKALDIQKSLALNAHHIHSKLHHTAGHDAEIISHVENTFLHPLRDSVRELSGHTNDLKNLLADEKQASLNLYLFDEYLQKA